MEAIIKGVERVCGMHAERVPIITRAFKPASESDLRGNSNLFSLWGEAVLVYGPSGYTQTSLDWSRLYNLVVISLADQICVLWLIEALSFDPMVNVSNNRCLLPYVNRLVRTLDFDP